MAIMLNKATFTVFDFETTGLFPFAGDRICEIGAIKMYPSKKTEKFHSMINPEREISYGAFVVNGITSDMVERAPRIEEILPRFIKFIEGSVLVAYNAGFDIGFFESALGKEKDILKDYPVIDVLMLARRVFRGLGRYNLSSVADSLGIPAQERHRAFSDAHMTLEVFKRALDILTADGAVTLEDIARVGPSAGKRVIKVKDYKIKIINDAILAQKRLNIVYRSQWSNKVSKRTVTPLEIQRGHDKNYLIAYCHLKEDRRNFIIESIVDVKPDKAKRRKRP
ncbi:MAG: WYL domain-containing protein [Candidatus Omnitrophica bacterium]|nr:WYL domain-containing protein [Candidatus Omnitrophota bacterium]